MVSITLAQRSTTQVLAETCPAWYLSFENLVSASRDGESFSYNQWSLCACRQYAVRYWVEHARKSVAKPEDVSLTRQLLHPPKPLIVHSKGIGYLNSADHVYG